MEVVITTPCGDVKGKKVQDGSIVAFKGIRYAKAERFKYPSEVTHWDGVYDATEYGACAYQIRAFMDEKQMPKKVFYYNEFRKGREYFYSEDCLFLNVFAPDKVTEQLPVIVYIHGGGYTGGCAHERHFDVPVWPKKGVIGVTINYRLGPLGFAVLPELKEESGRTGNYGLYDQLTALEWVRHNIAAFGGDPENITLMGQSAGAMSVQHHCLSPLSRGKFQRAVMCSGGGVSKLLPTPKPEKLYPFWQALKERLGATTLEELRAVPVDKLFHGWMELKKEMRGGRPMPCLDGELVTDCGCDILKRNEQHDIPYMLGTTSHDVIPPLLYSTSQKWAAKQKEAYLWFFKRNLPGDDHGAWHSADLWYWFGTLDNCWRPFEQKDYDLAEEMTDYLTAFAKTGKPNCEGGAQWKCDAKRPLTFSDSETQHAKPSKLKLWYTMFTNSAPGE